jgi:hypothetical protein
MTRCGRLALALILFTVATPLTSLGQPPQQHHAKPKTNVLLDALTEQQRPFSERQVWALQGNQAIQVTAENAKPLLSQARFTAEKLDNGPKKFTLTASLAGNFRGAKQAYLLPTRYTAIQPNNIASVAFNVVLVIVDALHYDPTQGKFAGAFALALINPSNANDHANLAEPFPVTIRADGADLTPPPPVSFTELQAPQTVHLVVPSPMDPYPVQAYTVLTQNPESIAIPVEHVGIELQPASIHIRGLGLETTDVNITVAAARGRSGEVVNIQASQGNVTPSSLTLDTNGTGKVVLQSAGLGTSTMSASDPPFDPGTVQVTFDWPVAFAVAALLGGIVGAALRPDVLTHLPQTLSIGVLAAIVLCAAHAVGVTLDFWRTPSGSAGEATFFVIAVVAGYLGRQVMSLLTKTDGAKPSGG